MCWRPDRRAVRTSRCRSREAPSTRLPCLLPDDRNPAVTLAPRSHKVHGRRGRSHHPAYPWLQGLALTADTKRGQEVVRGRLRVGVPVGQGEIGVFGEPILRTVVQHALGVAAKARDLPGEVPGCGRSEVHDRGLFLNNTLGPAMSPCRIWTVSCGSEARVRSTSPKMACRSRAACSAHPKPGLVLVRMDEALEAVPCGDQIAHRGTRFQGGCSGRVSGESAVEAAHSLCRPLPAVHHSGCPRASAARTTTGTSAGGRGSR